MCRILGAVVAGVLLAGGFGCKALNGLKGEDGSETKSADVSAEMTNIPIFSTKDDLPKCSKNNDGGIAYIQTEKAFYTCESGKWVFTSVKGEDGEPGAVISPIGDQWRKVWKKLVMSAVYIESEYVEDKDDGPRNCPLPRYESGSGYIIAQDLVVTNGHVAAKQKNHEVCGKMNLTEVRIWFPEDATGDTKHTSYESSDGTVVRIDRTLEDDYDTLLLDVPTGEREPMPLSKDGIAKEGLDGEGTKLNDDVLQIGFSGGTTFPHFATGKITQIAAAEKNDRGYGFLSKLVGEGLVKNGLTVLEYDLISGSGASGGAVVDLRGLVVGTNFAGNSKEADTEFGYAVPVQEILNILEDERVWDDLP